jgi:CheY-like chemotaxis protein
MGKMLCRLIGEDIELVTHPAESVWSVRVDPSQLEQVVVNLAVNARDAMPYGGRLSLETSNVRLNEEEARRYAGASAGDYVRLSISDTGIGMTDEIKAHLFEPFFTTKEIGKGTGLGLATCYGIVKQCGGWIQAYSEPEHGTTFKIYFPAVRETPTELPPRDGTGFLPRGDETILLVEDESLVRSLAARILRDQGYSVLEAVNGDEALQVVQLYGEKPIHLLLTDVVMPQMGGKALADRLRAIHPELRILFASGYSESSVYDLGISEAGVGFLQKPFTPGVLARKVRAVLDS